MSKGSNRRPQQISREEMEKRWEKAFGESAGSSSGRANSDDMAVAARMSEPVGSPFHNSKVLHGGMEYETVMPSDDPGMTIYVDRERGDDTNAGTVDSPLRSLPEALARIPDRGTIHCDDLFR